MAARPRNGGEALFRSWCNASLVSYAVVIALIISFTARYAGVDGYVRAFQDPAVRGALVLSVVTATIATILALIVAIPGAYALSRYRLPFRGLLDALIDLPIALPPLITGICLLIFFSPRSSFIGQFLADRGWEVVYTRPAIVLAQFMVAGGFTIRCLKSTFDALTPRYEQVARPLGCSAGRAFFTVTLPLARGGIVAGAVMTWAKSIGEFGPIIVFAGSVEGKTLVLPTAIFLKMAVGELEVMAAATMVLILISSAALLLFKKFGGQENAW